MKWLYSFVVSLAFLTVLVPAKLSAQYCGSAEYVDHLEVRFPGFKVHVDEQYLHSIKRSQVSSLYKLPPKDTVFVIQVVFHVVYRNNAQNISDALIIDQVKTLNEAYNRQNADTINMREIFADVAGSARIRFELATVDPDGNPTNGITRTATTQNTFNNNGTALQTDYIKQTSSGGKDAWDSDKYLNIWVGNLNLSNGNRALFGYAYPPVNADFWGAQFYKTKPYQGVVLHYEIVGKDNPSNLDKNLYTNEKTAIHEVGHYLGLRHVWGDAGWGQNGCLVDDFIDDTPNTFRQNSGCTYTNTCTGDNLPDQMENYMDYSSSVCTNMFTKQQVGVMRYNLQFLRDGLAKNEMVHEPVPEIGPNLAYPNPFQESINVFVEDPQYENITISFFDVLGREVLTSIQKADKYVLHVNTQAITIGLYHIKITSETRGLIYKSQVVKIQ